MHNNKGLNKMKKMNLFSWVAPIFLKNKTCNLFTFCNLDLYYRELDEKNKKTKKNKAGKVSTISLFSSSKLEFLSMKFWPCLFKFF